MGFKSKLGVGVMTGVLGLSLIGGGTYAAFNDVEEVSNTFKAGTLDLAVDESESFQFDISNLKPGDYFEKTIVLENKGSLDINKILTQVSADGWENEDVLDLEDKFGEEADNNMDDFLSQFKVYINGSKNGIPLNTMVNHNNPEDITGSGNEVGLKADESLEYDVKIKFVNNPETIGDSRYQMQNIYQGEGATLKFDFEATQMGGDDRSNDEVEPE
ncbi:TasA family protein [Alkalibacillus salilacus]|uniref:Spore coat-associated protein N n=1 Tax=Alkalibacillus salilacus TaxID=284582 RepID=A0ABT9VAV1_9BACI|nr:TasA family protein [Alkalibacillus salilacus]MDQ0158073.1 spore coat-associated protein N [Alkalibacillus salilacus]